MHSSNTQPRKFTSALQRACRRGTHSLSVHVKSDKSSCEGLIELWVSSEVSSACERIQSDTLSLSSGAFIELKLVKLNGAFEVHQTGTNRWEWTGFWSITARFGKKERTHWSTPMWRTKEINQENRSFCILVKKERNWENSSKLNTNKCFDKRLNETEIITGVLQSSGKSFRSV